MFRKLVGFAYFLPSLSLSSCSFFLSQGSGVCIMEGAILIHFLTRRRIGAFEGMLVMVGNGIYIIRVKRKEWFEERDVQEMGK